MADDFRESEVGERYAKALFDLAHDDKALEAVAADLASLRAMLAESADLRRFLASPAFGADDKRKALEAIADKAGLNPLSKKFLGYLAQSRRADALGPIATSFRRLYDKERGVVAAQVTTAVKLSAKQLAGVKAALAASLGREPEIATDVDPAILGGIKVQVGSRLFDASLKTKLDSLKFALKRA